MGISEFWFQYPHIYIFPRSKRTLFDYVENNATKARTGEIYYRDLLETYEDTTNTMFPEMTGSQQKKTKIKEIETRIYVDLWNQQKEEYDQRGHKKIITETVRKMTICFLKETKGIFKSYQYINEKPNFNRQLDEVQLVLKVDAKNTRKDIYIDGMVSGHHFTSKYSSTRSVYIPINEIVPDYMLECTIHICDSTRNLSGDEIEICAGLIHKDKGRDREIGNKTILHMYLYRCPEATNENNPFSILKGNNYDKDFFVMPRINQEEKHKPFIKKLQLYSNQVLARHKGLTQKGTDEAVQDGRFDFVKEDGIYTQQLGINYGMSINIFKKTKNAPVHPTSGLYAHIPYQLSTFGQAECIVAFAASNYDVAETTVKKILIDRHFMHGEKENQSNIDDAEGLKSLYDFVVRPFRERIILHAQQYVNFAHRWMPRPDETYNPKYQRGKLTIEAGVNIHVYNAKTGGVSVAVGNIEAGQSLPQGAEITFKAGYDDNYDNTNETIRYEIRSIRINGQTYSPANTSWYIPLTYTIKQSCRDNEEYPQNFCDYGELPPGLTDSNEITALNYYKTHNGVPYYISDPYDVANNPNGDGTGGKCILSDFNSRLNANVINWYSYLDSPNPSKPNSPTNRENNHKPGIGLDCSGLIMNCLLDTTSDDITESKFFMEGSSTIRPYGESAYDMGDKRTRLIPLDDTYNNEGDLLIQAGDLIYSKKVSQSDGRHIALCVIDPNPNNQPNLDIYLSKAQKDSRYFTIIHNYGNTWIYSSYFPSGRWDNGCFVKTLKGPFRHWGVYLNNQAGSPNSFAGRIYLWYEDNE
jgi:hypothetical protein